MQPWQATDEGSSQGAGQRQIGYLVSGIHKQSTEQLMQVLQEVNFSQTSCSWAKCSLSKLVAIVLTIRHPIHRLARTGVHSHPCSADSRVLWWFLAQYFKMCPCKGCQFSLNLK